MRRSALLLGLISSLAAAPITAQTVIQPETPLSPEQVEARDVMVTLRDSLNSVTAASARLVRSVGPASSSAWLLARARNIATACTRSRTTMAVARPVLEEGPGTTKSQVNAHRNLLAAMTGLDTTLVSCEKTWKARSSAAHATVIREQGPSEVEALNREVQSFDKKLAAYASTRGIRLPPMGSGTPVEVP